MKLNEIETLLSNGVQNKEFILRKYEHLKQKQLDLSFFVPISDDGLILSEPFEENYYDSDGLNYHLFALDCEQYEKANETVIFNGFKPTYMDETIYIVDANNYILARSLDDGYTFTFTPYETIGDLIGKDFEFELKESKYFEVLGYATSIKEFFKTLTGETWEVVSDKLVKYPFEVGMIYLYKRRTKQKMGRLKYLKPSTIVESGVFLDMDNENKEMTFEYSDMIIDLTLFEYNPMIIGREKKCTENKNYSLGSVLHTLKQDTEVYTHTKSGLHIKPFTNNPFVVINGERIYYQRPLVWSLEDKQNLIESIYNYNGCGLIVFRFRSCAWIEEQTSEEDTAWVDIVDGKQRVDAILGFINNDYHDKNGRYFSEFSDRAKRMFLDHQLFSYAEIKEDTPDEKVLAQFLKINTTGVAQDKNHLLKLSKFI